jgi:hypothetical protein
MAFNINDFLGNGLTRGGARPSLFDVVMTFPGDLGEAGSVGVEALSKLRFTCRATSIPASTIGEVAVPYFGRQIKLAGDRVFANWSVTVMNDEDYSVRDAFEVWHNSINTIISNRKTGIAPNGYKSGIATVTQYSKEGSAIKQYDFINIFPLNLDEMGLDWDATNQIQTFGVTFAYDYWVPADSNGSVSMNIEA